MDIDSLRQVAGHANAGAVGIAFLAGLFFSVNPVAIAAIPVSLAYVTKARDKQTAFMFGFMFILGLIATHALLGVAAGFGGKWVEALLGRFWGLLLGPLLIFLGLVWRGWIKIPLPAASFQAKRATNMWAHSLLACRSPLRSAPFALPRFSFCWASPEASALPYLAPRFCSPSRSAARYRSRPAPWRSER